MGKNTRNGSTNRHSEKHKQKDSQLWNMLPQCLVSFTETADNWKNACMEMFIFYTVLFLGLGLSSDTMPDSLSWAEFRGQDFLLFGGAQKL